MDIISRAMAKKLHISQSEKWNKQSWEEFEMKCKGKTVFMFGISASCEMFIKRYHGAISLAGVLDNDKKKQGFLLGDYIAEAIDTEYEKLRIYDTSVLENYRPDEIIVIVTSINYYEAIIHQLEKIGFVENYILLMMEANQRIKKENKEVQSVAINHREDYVEYCCTKAINPKKIVFYAFGLYSDHEKYITEALLKIRDDLELVWIVKDLNTEVPAGVRKVYNGNWKKYIYEMETAKIWIYNMVIPSFIVKRPGQIYIQTKHWASVTLKKFYLDASTIQGVSEKVANWKYNSRIMDYIITGSNFDTESCRRGFEFEKECIQIGSPRSDALFSKDKYREKVYNFYGMDTTRQTLIYAPTYRFNKLEENQQHELRAIELDYEEVKNALEKRFGGKWYIMLRLHPSVAKEGVKIKKPNFVIDASCHEDSEELVASCDIMISDYSSIMFEPAFVKKPVFLFATDRREYIDKEYDFLIDYDELPFKIAENNEELVKSIESFNYTEYEKDVTAFLEKYGVHEDGHASERATEFISNLIDK